MTAPTPLLTDYLAFCVPLRIQEYLAQGGPADFDRERAQGYATQIGEHGDAILYREPQETGRMVTVLVDSLAILAFEIGGVRAFGQHWRAELPTEPPDLARQWMPT